MQEFDKLYSWINSWKQDEGYGGFLHHAIHGTVNWEHASIVPSYTYEPLINCFINLYINTDNKVWLDKAEQTADDLFNIIDKTGQFKFSGFEFAPKSGSIVHTINPLFALMKLYELTNKKKYLNVVRNVLESVTAVFWRGNNFAGPFNMTLMTAAAIAQYCKLSGDWRLHEMYGNKCFEMVKHHKVGPEGKEAEGLYYRNSNDHSIIFPWYNTVKASAMIRYGCATGQQYWIEEGISLLKIIKKLFRDDYTLPHSFQLDESGTYNRLDTPVLIAPVAYSISIMQQYGVMTKKEVQTAIESILSKQTSIGFVPCNEGYDWRGYIGVTAWNCFVLELLSQNEVLDTDNVIVLDDYSVEYEGIKIYENEKELTISYKNDIIIVLEKKTGIINKHEILEADFHIDRKIVSEAVHLVRLNKQRHYSVSYIDNSGNGIWLQNHQGTMYAWSPYSVLDASVDGEISVVSKQKYDKFSYILYRIIKPFLYCPIIVNFILGKLRN